MPACMEFVHRLDYQILASCLSQITLWSFQTRVSDAWGQRSGLGMFSGHNRLKNVVSFLSVIENDRDAFSASFL